MHDIQPWACPFRAIIAAADGATPTALAKKLGLVRLLCPNAPIVLDLFDSFGLFAQDGEGAAQATESLASSIQRLAAVRVSHPRAALVSTAEEVEIVKKMGANASQWGDIQVLPVKARESIGAVKETERDREALGQIIQSLGVVFDDRGKRHLKSLNLNRFAVSDPFPIARL